MREWTEIAEVFGECFEGIFARHGGESLFSGRCAADECDGEGDGGENRDDEEDAFG